MSFEHPSDGGRQARQQLRTLLEKAGRKRRGLIGGEYARFIAEQARRGGCFGPNGVDVRSPADAWPESPPMRAVYSPSSDGPVVLDRRLATPGELELIEIGNPAHPRLIREWERKEGRDWPRDPVTGRRFDVAHIKAKADGGTDTLDNIRPMHPLDHRAEHKANGDDARWARRQHIARAFGGRVARALGPLGLLPNITGILSGRIRTDSFDNFTSDMMGWPSKEDRQKASEYLQRLINPDWKPGDPEVI